MRNQTFTTRQRLIEQTASQLRSREAITQLDVNSVTEEIAYRLGGDYKRYYDNMDDAAWRRFFNSVRRRHSDFRKTAD